MTTKPECTLGHQCDACNVPEMALRDWFAGIALKFVLANTRFGGLTPDEIAALAFKQADAMMREREK